MTLDADIGPYGFPPIPFDVEDLELYRPGGLHPLIVGDTLGDEDRYEVVHKLGHGGYAIVWLCWDYITETWKAIKVIASNASENAAEFGILKFFDNTTDEELEKNHVCLPREHFSIDGPNGRHLCIVMPVFGESTNRIWKDYARWPKFLRRICRQMTVAMKLLHDKGVCHGDFRPQNILFKIRNVDKLSYEEIMSVAGESVRIPVPPIPNTGVINSPHLPPFLYPASALRPPCDWLTGDIVVADFGEAYHVSKPREETGIPLSYCAPEGELPGYSKGYGMDVWSLAATFCEIRQGAIPFDEDSIMGYFQSVEDQLGPLPEPYRSEWINRGFTPRAKLPPASQIPADQPLSMTSKMLANLHRDRLEDEGYETRLEALVRNKTSFLKRLRQDEVLGENEYDAGDDWKRVEYQIPQEEADQLMDLLTKTFKYNPAERLSVSEVLEHPWLKDDGDRGMYNKDWYDTGMVDLLASDGEGGVVNVLIPREEYYGMMEVQRIPAGQQEPVDGAFEEMEEEVFSAPADAPEAQVDEVEEVGKAIEKTEQAASSVPAAASEAQVDETEEGALDTVTENQVAVVLPQPNGILPIIRIFFAWLARGVFPRLYEGPMVLGNFTLHL